MPLSVSIFYILGITTVLIDQKLVLNIMCISKTKIIWSMEDGLSPGKVGQSWGKGRAWRDLVFWNLFLRLKLAFLGGCSMLHHLLYSCVLEFICQEVHMEFLCPEG